MAPLTCTQLSWGYHSFQNHDTQESLIFKFLNQQTRVYPYPLGAGSARPNPKMGAPPLLLKNVSQYTSPLYCNTPPISIAVVLVPLGSKEREKSCQYSSHLYRSTPPICIAIHLPFVSQYFCQETRRGPEIHGQ